MTDKPKSKQIQNAVLGAVCGREFFVTGEWGREVRMTVVGGAEGFVVVRSDDLDETGEIVPGASTLALNVTLEQSAEKIS
tara:strand:- start:59 stop:298 length:240 start_codon:yes stop_codon:yes gene_type:complete